MDSRARPSIVWSFVAAVLSGGNQAGAIDFLPGSPWRRLRSPGWRIFTIASIDRQPYPTGRETGAARPSTVLEVVGGWASGVGSGART